MLKPIESLGQVMSGQIIGIYQAINAFILTYGLDIMQECNPMLHYVLPR